MIIKVGGLEPLGPIGVYAYDKKVKVANTRLPSVGFRSYSRIFAVSLQVTGDVSNKPGGRVPLLSARPAVTLATLNEGCYQFRRLVNRGMIGVNSLPKTVTRQRRGCNLNPGPSAPAR